MLVMNKKKINALKQESDLLRVQLNRKSYWLNHAFYFIISHGYLKEYSDFKDSYRGVDPHADAIKYMICTLYPEYQDERTRNRNRLCSMSLDVIDSICKLFHIHS